jgi:hypothetical protein
MGFCFNRQLRVLPTIEKKVKVNKSKARMKSKVIRHLDIRSKTHPRREQLSAKDYSFLQSIGLKVARKPRK